MTIIQVIANIINDYYCTYLCEDLLSTEGLLLTKWEFLKYLFRLNVNVFCSITINGHVEDDDRYFTFKITR